jgi:uncharacterized integral membrane protein (TIGR00698 family)
MMPIGSWLGQTGPGLVLSVLVALVSFGAEQGLLGLWNKPVPAAVLALVIGMMVHGPATQPRFADGLAFASKKLLQVAIALLGLRIALADIVALGITTVLIVIGSMALTLAAGLGMARWLGRSDAYGALAGGATAICGASAALAISSVIPDKQRNDADTAFVVLACNLLATLAMIAYPLVAGWLHFDERMTGIFLGASIHDVAQVVGAGLSVSEATAGTATIVKIFRVFLLLPVVLVIGHLLRRHQQDSDTTLDAKVPVPLFAFAFLALAGLNSFDLVPQALRMALLDVSRWGLLVAIAALGLKTSLAALIGLGWRHLLVMVSLMAVIALSSLFCVAVLLVSP